MVRQWIGESAASWHGTLARCLRRGADNGRAHWRNSEGTAQTSEVSGARLVNHSIKRSQGGARLFPHTDLGMARRRAQSRGRCVGGGGASALQAHVLACSAW